MRYARLWPVALVALSVSACSDRPTLPTGPAESPPSTDAGIASARTGQARLERLARRTARALRDPAFRADVKAALDRSTAPEGKVHFQRYLKANGSRGYRVLAAADSEAEGDVEAEASNAGALEMYFPVKAHRAAWTGDENVLVATAEKDGDSPVAYDLAGRRIALSVDAPPGTPVLAVEPAEYDFDAPRVALATCNVDECGGGGGLPTVQEAGLYMSKAEFVESFESWLKGDPEYEIHIMGPAAKGDKDNLISFQCIGEHAPTGYKWDSNSKSWTGNQLLFSKKQIDAMAVAYPNVPFTIMAYEDDDTACAIKTDSDRAGKLLSALGTFTKDYKSAKSINDKLEAAPSLFKLLTALYSFLTTADDIIGVAISDAVTSRYHAGTNWTILNEKTTANGWLQLDIKK